MAFHCPNCGAAIPAHNINIQKTLALCDECSTVFNFGDHDFSPERPKRKVKQPHLVSVKDNNDQLALRYKWSIRTAVPHFLTVLMGIWLLVSTVAAISGLSGDESGAIFFGVLFGLFPAYYFVSLAVNSSYFHGDGQTLAVQSKPLPWFDQKRVDIQVVESIVYQPSKSFPEYYDVCAKLHDGTTRIMLELVPYEYGVYIAQRLNDYVRHLDDGEYPVHHLLDEDDGAVSVVDDGYPVKDEEHLKAKA